MAETRSELIVLNTTKVGEKSVVLHTLGRGWGRRSLITGIRSASMAMFLPLSIIDGEVSTSTKTDLWRIRNISPACPLNGIRSSAHKNSIAMFVSEVLYRTVREASADESLYDWCRRSILLLDGLDGDFSNFHLRFLLELAVALGFSPGSEDIVPFAEGHEQEIRTMLASDFPEAMLQPLNGKARGEIAEALVKYIGYHADIRLSVRSLEVLKELYR